MLPKEASLTDFVLNVLLFVPFGFGVSLQTRKRGGGRWTCLLLALAAGAVASYTVEVLQLYVPSRDSSWDDVVSKTLGSVVGFFLFELCGDFIVKRASRCEGALEGWLSPLRTVLLLALYFGIWFGASVLLQQETRLSNWDARSLLVVGNDASGRNPWKGAVYRLQIWDRAVSEEQIARLDRHGLLGGDANLLASYDLGSPPPYADQLKFLPELAYTSNLRPVLSGTDPGLDGRFELSTKIPVEGLTRAIQKTNQFTVRIVCAPAAIQDAGGRIVAMSQSEENVNFNLRQEGSRLAFWFRNPLSETRSILVWYADHVFEAGKTRDIVASYDGSDAFLYVNGMRVPQMYRLGPGASLAHRFLTVQTGDLEGYVALYEIVIFLPAGLLVGMAGRRWSEQKASERWMISIALLLPAILLEFLLVWISGRRVWGQNIVFSALVSVAGAALINADLRGERSPSSSTAKIQGASGEA